MNVQTLPPGYKTAPWTPPEKIDGKMMAEAAGQLIEILRIANAIGNAAAQSSAMTQKARAPSAP